MRDINTKKANAVPMTRCNYKHLMKILLAYQNQMMPATPREISQFHEGVSTYDVSVSNRLLFYFGWVDGVRPRFQITKLGKEVLEHSFPDIQIKHLRPFIIETLRRFEFTNDVLNLLMQYESHTREDYILNLELVFVELNQHGSKSRTNAVLWFDLLLTAGILYTEDYHTYRFT